MRINSAIHFIALCVLASMQGCETNSPMQKGLPLSTVMAEPNRYDGREIRVVGYLTLDFEGTALYQSKMDCLNDYLNASIWLNVRPIYLKQRYQRCSPVWVIGDYIKAGKHGSGHLGAWAGELNVTNIGQGSIEFLPKLPRKTLLNDSEIGRLLIGIWVVSSQNSTFDAPKAYVTFTADGLTTEEEFSDKGCVPMYSRAAEQFQVHNGALQIAGARLIITYINKDKVEITDAATGMTRQLLKFHKCENR